MYKLYCPDCDKTREVSMYQYDRYKRGAMHNGIPIAKCRSHARTRTKTEFKRICKSCGDVKIFYNKHHSLSDICKKCYSKTMNEKLAPARRNCYTNIKICIDCKSVQRGVEGRMAGSSNRCKDCNTAYSKANKKVKVLASKIHFRICEDCGKKDTLKRKSDSKKCNKCQHKEFNKFYKAPRVDITCDKCNKVFDVLKQYGAKIHYTKTCKDCRVPHNKKDISEPKERKWFPLTCKRCGLISHYKTEEGASHDNCGTCRRIIGSRSGGRTNLKKGYQPVSSKPDKKPRRDKTAKVKAEHNKWMDDMMDATKKKKDGIEQRAMNDNENQMIAEFLARKGNNG